MAVTEESANAERRHNRRAWYALFIGFSGVTACLGTLWWLRNGTSLQGYVILWSSLFLIFSILALPRGIRLVVQSTRKTRVVLWALVPALILTPAYGVLGAVFFVSAPSVYGLVAPPNFVQSITSPDGAYEAYVDERPSIDPPNQSLYVGRKDEGDAKRVAKLLEDWDSVQKIHWSPDSDIVVFRSRLFLTAVEVPGYRTESVPLFGERLAQRLERHTGPLDNLAQAGHQDTTVEFRDPGTFSYQLRNGSEFRTVEMGSP